MIAAISLVLLLFINIPNPTDRHSAAGSVTYEDQALSEGRKAFASGDYQHAIETLTPYVEKKQKSFDGYLYLGLSYQRLQQFDQAILALEKAVTIKPKSAQAHFELGQTYLLAKNYEAAIKQYQWLRKQKKDPWLAEELRFLFPAEIAQQYQLPPSLLGQYQADLDAAQPVLPMAADLKPTIAYRERAKYTEEARSQKVQGTIVLKIVFSKQGKLLVVGVVRGLPNGLTESAIEAARKIRFTPAMKDGQAVSVIGNIEFNFTLY